MNRSIPVAAIAFIIVSGILAIRPAQARNIPLPGIRQAGIPHQTTKAAPHGLGKRLASGSGSIAGTVFQSNGSTPMADGYLVVADTFGYEVAEIYLGSISAGSYDVNNLYPGSYLVFFRSSYPNSSRCTYLGNTTTVSQARWVHLTAGQTVAGQNITASALSGNTGIIISGRAFSGSSADPLSNASISFSSASRGATMGFYTSLNTSTTFTQSDGSYSCTTSIDTGSYYIRITAQDYSSENSYAPIWWDGTTVTSEPGAVHISGNVGGKDLRFPIGGKIVGQVSDDSALSNGASIYIQALDQDGYCIDEDYLLISSTGNKRFVIENLPAGSYVLRILPSSLYYAYYYNDYTSSEYYATQYYNGAATWAAAMHMVVSAGDSITIPTIKLKHNPLYSPTGQQTGSQGRVQGTITREDGGAAVPGVEVLVMNAGGGLYSSYVGTSSDSVGHYSLSVSTDSAFFVTTYPLSQSPEYYLCETFYNGVLEQTQATTITLAPNETKQIDVTMKTGGSIAGLMYDRNGQKLVSTNYVSDPYSPYAVGVAYSNTSRITVTGTLTTLSGMRFSGTPEGVYTVRIIPYPPEIFGETSTTAVDFGFATVNNITVSKGNTTILPPVTMPHATGSITGAIASTPQSTQSYGYEYKYVYCYSADSLLAGFGLGMTDTVSGSARSKFFSREADAAAAATYSTYNVTPLPAGRYALALVDMYTSEPTLHWYGASPQPFTYVDDAAVLKPQIPANAIWITVGDGATVADINFGTIGTRLPFTGKANGRMKMQITRLPMGNGLAINYSLPGSASGRQQAKVEIFDMRGTRIRAIAIEKANGRVIWDRTNESQKSIGSGFYVFRLSSKTASISVPAMVSGR